MFKLLDSNRGMALPLVLVVLVILVMFSTAMLGMGSTDTLVSTNDSHRTQAYYYAHSGAEAVASYIVENPDNLSASEMSDLVDNMIANGDSSPFSLSPSDSGSIVVNVSRSGNTISVLSKAGYQGVQESVTLNINESVSGGESFDKAVYSSGDMEIIGQTINGNIAGLSNISLDYGNINGTVYIHPDSDSSVFSSHEWNRPPVANLTDTFEYPEFPFPEFPAYPTGLTTTNQTLNVTNNTKINANRYYTNGIKVASGGTLEITRGNQDRIIRTKYLKVSDQREVKDISSGSGNLKIFVDDYLELTGSSTIIFNLGDGDIIIRAKKLLLPQGHIVVKQNGTGKLYIYVDDVFQIDGDSKINVDTDLNTMGNADKAFVYYAGTKDANGRDITDGNNYLNFSNNIKIAATLQLRKAQASFQNSTGVTGNIISGGKQLIFNGGTFTDVKAIYAPNARIKVDQGANIRGIIVSDSFTMNGGATVTYQPLGEDALDFFKVVTGNTEYTYGNWE